MRKGFTLIELLVVVGIIGVLAALVLVVVGNARDKAKDARAVSNLGQLRSLAAVYYYSNSPIPPYEEEKEGYEYIDWCMHYGHSLFSIPAYCPEGLAKAVEDIRDDMRAIKAFYFVYGKKDTYCMHVYKPSDLVPMCIDSEGIKYDNSICSYGSNEDSVGGCVAAVAPYPNLNDPGCLPDTTDTPNPWPSPTHSPFTTACPSSSSNPSPSPSPT